MSIRESLTFRIVYRDNMTDNKTDEHKYYYGIPDTPFKDWFENYKMSFRHRSHLTDSNLSKCYWKLVDNDVVPTMKFSVTKFVKDSTFINNCNLCLSEKEQEIL